MTSRKRAMRALSPTAQANPAEEEEGPHYVLYSTSMLRLTARQLLPLSPALYGGVCWLAKQSAEAKAEYADVIPTTDSLTIH